MTQHDITVTITLKQHPKQQPLPLFSLIHDFGKQNTCGNISKISVSLASYRQIGSKSTNHSH